MIFLILVVIQFVVVTNGAGRVAEVGARFTLDAMPGKQMAIDADLNAGLITDDQARTRRAEIADEADFYGAMDGASKFVKGDAMAALIIVAINLIGGIVVGMVQHGLSFPEATHTYSLLTVGDGLAAQIPALLISVATGIIVTRAASDKRPRQRHRRADPAPAQGPARRRRGDRHVRADPGLPKLPFLLIGGLFAAWAGRSSDGLPGNTDCRSRGRRRGGHPAAGRGAAGRGDGRPAGARDRLRPRAAGRRRPGGLAAAAREHDPPADRRRTRPRDPAGADPRRARASNRTSTC